MSTRLGLGMSLHYRPVDQGKDAVVTGSFLVFETTGYILLETGFKIVLE